MEARASMAVGARIRLSGDLPQALVDELRAALTHENPAYSQAKRFGFYKKVPRFIATFADERDAISLPRGAMGLCRELLRKYQVRADVHDERCMGDTSMAGEIPPHLVELWPFQAEAADECVRRETAMLRAGCGAGKTTAMLALISRLNLPALVVVWNEKLLRQWTERIERELGVPRSWVGIIGDGKRTLGPITIGMQQTLWRMVDEVRDAFGVVVVDEMQRTPGRTLLTVIDRMPARYRFGASDDERRADRMEFLTHDMFGPDPVAVSDAELVHGGHTLEVSVELVPTDADVPWWPQLQEQIRELESRPGNEKVLKALRREQVQAYGRLLDELSEDAQRNQALVDLAAREVLAGEQVLLMTHRREHAAVLDRLLNARGVQSGFIIGGKPDQVESDRTVEGLRSGRLRAAVGTYQAVGVGVDLPTLSRGVFATPVLNNANGKSQFRQFRGRFSRSAKGKSPPVVYYPWDLNVFGAKPLRHACRWSKSVTVRWQGGIRPGREVLKEIER